MTHSDWLTSEMTPQGLELGQQGNENTSLIYDITTNYLPILLVQTFKQALLTNVTVYLKKREGYEWLSLSKHV